MTLAALHTGQQAVIVKVNGHGSFRKRLVEMGFIRGKKVRVVLNAPLKDPIEYEVMGYRLSLRREEAARIEVVSEGEAIEALVSDEHLQGLPVDMDRDERIERALAHVAEERRHVIRVALVGNPNCGKTSLFNMASGSHEHVGNYSGVTVDAREGRLTYKEYEIVLVDLPGTYSLSAYSPEERYVRQHLLEEIPDIVLNVVDASNLERNLYLTTQLIDMNLRMVMALNMFDEFTAKGDRLDVQQFGWLLGMPVCPTVSRSGEGLPDLLDTLIAVYEQNDPRLARHIHINHGVELERSINRLQDLLWRDSYIPAHYSTRWLSIKYLENDREVAGILEARPGRDELIAARFEEEQRLRRLLGTGAESAIVDAKYAFVQGALAEVYHPRVSERPRRSLTDKIDAVVTNRWLAFPIFLLFLYVVFQVTFSLGQYPMDWIDWLVGKVGEGVGALMTEGWLKDLVVNGLIAGAGSVLVFLPTILILYFFISLMEDSGYMSRAAFIMDKLMHKIGLHGKSFIPMVMGFGCNVPAILSTRIIESRKSRWITIAIIPFMSCAGRLPVFVLLAGAFFPRTPALALLGIYLLGIVLAVLSAVVLSRFIREDDLPFVMELPPYRMPTWKAIGRHTWEKGRQYLQKIATTIMLCSLIIWALGYFPHTDAPDQKEQSYLAMVGKAVSPAMEPLGFNWKMDVGLITGVAAKELVVSSLGVMYAGDTGGTDESLGDSQLQEALCHDLTLPAAVAFMIFILLYFPCIATFLAIKQETGRWRWAILCCTYTILVAWLFAFLGNVVTALLI